MALSVKVKREVRTVLQAGTAVAVALPGVVAASGVPAQAAFVAAGLAVAGGFARVMALDSVQAILGRFGLDTREPAPVEDKPAA